ncbi:MAG: 30S ribosome-binding factor RbfA [Oscillospiraceae bacterium]|nr:30S ribosome-binding factor RbfA [Oscillospiraceae bacterium]
MNKNIQRLAEDIKREISVTMREVGTDGIVSVSHCELSNDLSYCKVFISTYEGGEKTVQAAEKLKTKAGLFKKHINARIRMRKIPELIFLPDNSLDYYDKITGIIDELNESKHDENNNDSTNGSVL